MNTMQALRFFVEVLCGAASLLIVAAWVMLFFLRRKVREKRMKRIARETRGNRLIPEGELVRH
jgi:hypothetical protein